MKETEIVVAHGHELVQSTHRTTMEITRDETLTRRGDCIIAVGADKGASDLSWRFKELAKRKDAEIVVVIEAGGLREVVRAMGDPRLTFTHPRDLVIRRSNYVCGRTVAVNADKAAKDLSRDLVNLLRDSNRIVRVILTVKVP